MRGRLKRFGEKEKPGIINDFGLFLGAPAGIRTPDTLLKRQVLCLLSYWGIGEGDLSFKSSAGGGRRVFWLGWRDSNPLYRSQSPVCYHYTTSQNIFVGSEAAPRSGLRALSYGVGDGARTHDTRNHNPVLCQLSYTHHMSFGTPRGIRTPDLLLRRQLLYPAELLAHIQGPTGWSG